MSETLEIFAATGPGLEPLAATELRALGIEGRVVGGGVEWTGSLPDVYRACLNLRVASRILVRMGRFRARSFIELERHLGRIDWTALLVPGRDIALRVSSGKSRLYHERAIAERVSRQLARYECHTFAAAVPKDADESYDEVPPVDDTEGESDRRASAPRQGSRKEGGQPKSGVATLSDAQLIVVRFHRDECVISLDASGALLHRRGYRQAIARAPLRETLAAAVLLASGWRMGDPLIDPFCGSGTIPIEAALMARKIPPGLASPGHSARSYSFQRWVNFDAQCWEEIVGTARALIEPLGASLIRGSDRDAGAISAARANADRAGVGEDVEFVEGAFSELRCPGSQAWIVTNPPYGVRIGDSGPLRNLYESMGRVVRERCRGASLAMMSADPTLTSRMGLDWRDALRTVNGGVPVKLLVARI